MGHWLVLGLLLAGCGVGALLTGLVYLVQLRKIKAALQQAAPGGLKDKSHVGLAQKSESQRRSA
jgi:hypothetical protein